MSKRLPMAGLSAWLRATANTTPDSEDRKTILQWSEEVDTARGVPAEAYVPQHIMERANEGNLWRLAMLRVCLNKFSTMPDRNEWESWSPQQAADWVMAPKVRTAGSDSMGKLISALEFVIRHSDSLTPSDIQRMQAILAEVTGDKQ
jgi:hypothetical protein